MSAHVLVFLFSTVIHSCINVLVLMKHHWSHREFKCPLASILVPIQILMLHRVKTRYSNRTSSQELNQSMEGGKNMLFKKDWALLNSNDCSLGGMELAFSLFVLFSLLFFPQCGNIQEKNCASLENHLPSELIHYQQVHAMKEHV